MERRKVDGVEEVRWKRKEAEWSFRNRKKSRLASSCGGGKSCRLDVPCYSNHDSILETGEHYSIMSLHLVNIILTSIAHNELFYNFHFSKELPNQDAVARAPE